MVNTFLIFTRNSRASAILTSQSRRDCVETSVKKQSAQQQQIFDLSNNTNFVECSRHSGQKERRMMSPKRWILLLIFYISYLMFGASIYYHIEHRLEAEQIQEEEKERARIHCKCLKQP